jgi:hypothetical protein
VEATTAQPLSPLAVDALAIAEDDTSGLAPELKGNLVILIRDQRAHYCADALNTSFISHYDHSISDAPLTAPVERPLYVATYTL